MLKRLLSMGLAAILILLPVCSLAAQFSADPDAIERAAKSVLMLDVLGKNADLLATGSGFVAFNNRTLVTNYHVIEDADWMMAYSDDGYEYMVTKILITDPEKDIAICEFMSPTDLTPLELNTDGELKRAENVVAIGNPLGTVIGMTNTVSIGNISALYDDGTEKWIQFTAPISHGSSGGALFDDQGRVIGMTSAFLVDAQNMNLAIHISEIAELYTKAPEKAVDFSKYQATPEPTATPTPKPTPVPTPAPKASGESSQYHEMKLYEYDKAELYNVQLALEELGYYHGETYIKGAYGSSTMDAVSKFNKQYGFSRDNPYVISVEMQEKLFSFVDIDALQNAATPTTAPTPKATTAPKASGESSQYHEMTIYKYDQVELSNVQSALEELGYYKGSHYAKGTYGSPTMAAVSDFNAQYGFSQDKPYVITIEMQEKLFSLVDIDALLKKPTATLKPTSTPKPASTPKPTEPPAQYKYKSLKKGDKGEEVKRLQEALIKLGYLDGVADEIYGKKTDAAVKAFNKINGIVSNDATQRMQQMLFEGNPKPYSHQPASYSDPKMVLYIKNGAYAEWKNLSNDKMSIHFQVSNKGKKKTVKAFELYVYAEDVWGNELYGNNVYYATTTKKVAPGKTVYSDYITIPKRSSIATVSCGIHKVAYTDGTTYTVPKDQIDYATWTID